MKKIPTVYVRDPANPKYVTDEVNPGCEWVLDGEGTPTRKWDGTCTMLDDNGRWWARREVKPGKAEPPGWVEVDADPNTGKRTGWEPIEQSSHYRSFLDAEPGPEWLPGTFELIGPKINGNPEGWTEHALIRHGTEILDIPPGADDIKLTVAYLGAKRGWEGVVWHHPDGRMAKLKARDLRAHDPSRT